MEVIDLTSSDTEPLRLPRVRRPCPIPDDPELVLVSEKLKHAPKPREPAPPRNPSTPTPSKRPRLKTTEAPQVVGLKKGIKPLEDYPHARFACTQQPYSAQNARKYCPKCFCFVCDVLASTCQEWERHCNAVDNEEWKMERREKRKASRRYERGVDLLAKEARRREKRSRKEKERREVLEALGGEILTFEQLMAEQMEAVSEFYKGMVADPEQHSPQENQQNVQAQTQTNAPPPTLPTPQDAAQCAGEKQLSTDPLMLQPMRNASSASPRVSFGPPNNPASNVLATARQVPSCCPKHGASDAFLHSNCTSEAELARLSNVFLSFNDDHPDGFALGEITGEERSPTQNDTLDGTRRILELERSIYAGLPGVDRTNSRLVETSPSGRTHARISSAAKRAKRKEKRSKHRQRVRSRSRMKKSDEQ
ncbi:hypothetical protein BWQ96_04188 [Gracilariopsis chorda]|uniref:Uncharacterized protein n=1 Tax=Gracilariopsis chorda TaxID=448386 RepID=A0A2V3IVA2_9FLOR|nr:hypothetical protein BWQ96_04188 [Gracilariopsis chorda]|eukprot:PXF46013.1 hypothetical protein BWQ96_04188 [Gracilariopsis chorda]